MAYEMMLYPKEKTPQTVPVGSYTSDLYTSYAELFDLSLLPNDGEVPLSPQSQLQQGQQNQQQQQQQQQLYGGSDIGGPNNNGPAQSPEYIPATIFHDVPSPDAGSMQQLKQEPGSVASVWSDTWSNSSGYLSCGSINGSNPASPESPASSYGLLDHPHTQQQSVPARGSSLQDHHQRLLSPYGGEQTIKTEYDSGAETSIDLDSLLGDSPSPYHTQQQQQHPATVKVEEADLDALLYSFSPSSVLEAQQVPAVPAPAPPPPASKPQQGFQILREHLQDTSFQRRHNLKPLELDSLIGGLTTHADIGPVFEYALQEMKNGVQATCTELGISSDPKQWPTAKVHQWLELAMGKYSLPRLENLGALFPENGAQLAALPLEEFVRRIPQGGDKLHGHLELWKQIHRLMVGDTSMASVDSSMICDGTTTGTIGCPMPNVQNFTAQLAPGVVPMMPESGANGASALPTGLVPVNTSVPALTSSTMSPAMVDNFDSDSMNDDISDDDDEDMTVESPGSSSSAGGPSGSGATTSTGATPKRHGGSHIHLWQFLKELLACPEQHQNAIRWIDRSKGVFKIEDSVRVARLWGRRKNRPAMNYDKLSRSIRQYYKKGIMQKTERSQRLVYQFCSPYAL
ncbi:DNA-binding protein D-ETS-4-like [Anopheles albimanus]|uniref:DNA-binding protein D-ETS-4-like n=1 Tax=Anopheles albimanus TaxID=7167 RepID=UPI001641398D|nr:DNA-binding protein D-ETS-4-like [Anopheles albimanus]